jgi:methylase of polypeptide subunit release factors
LPAQFRDTLTAVGLDFARHRLIRHCDLWIFCERLHPAVDLYHGDDSVGLSRLMLPSRGRCLDLCAGVGTQGLLCARTAKSLVAVEIQEKANLFFWLNAVLNGLAAKVEFRSGDFVEPVAGERFDHIVCNPPLLPIPHDIDYPIVGHGGADGLDFPRRLLPHLPALLNPGGRCHIIGTLLGGPIGPDLSEWEKAAKTTGIDLLAILPFRGRLASDGPLFRSLVASATLFAEHRRLSSANADSASAVNARAEQAYRQYFIATGATHLYSFLLCATNAARPTGTFHCTRHFMDARRMWSR